MGTLLKSHLPCPACGSRDALAIFDDGTHCYSCGDRGKGDGRVVEKTEDTKADFIEGDSVALPNRGLTQATCEFWGYQTGQFGNDPCHIANFRDIKGRLVAQKIRRSGKRFNVVGDGKNIPLYGMWLWSGGKSVVITEGELDALSVSQAFGNKYPVLSLPQGAQSAKKVLQTHYEYLDNFEKIVLCFDNDEPGQKAVEEASAVLPAGKVYIMQLPTKDANDCLVHHGPEPITKAYWNAREWRPDGIVSAKELREEVLNPIKVECVPYPFSGLNEKLGGIRIGELVTITAGSGVGKSTLVRELIYDLAVKKGLPVGVMALEESNKRTMEGLMSIHLSQNIVISRELVSNELLAKAFDEVAVPNLYLFDHFGSTEVENILNRVRYMAKALGVKYVVIDHLSILVSGLTGGDERKMIDVAMTKLRTLVSELNVAMIVVSHLKRPEGNKGHEDGAEVHLGQLRGSHSIAQLSDGVIGLQRNSDTPDEPNIEVIVLKNRWSGDRGPAGLLSYSRETGRLSESMF